VSLISDKSNSGVFSLGFIFILSYNTLAPDLHKVLLKPLNIFSIPLSRKRNSHHNTHNTKGIYLL
jgi:hypothetical protein